MSSIKGFFSYDHSTVGQKGIKTELEQFRFLLKDTLTDSTRLPADILHSMRDQRG